MSDPIADRIDVLLDGCPHCGTPTPIEHLPHDEVRKTLEDARERLRVLRNEVRRLTEKVERIHRERESARASAEHTE